MTIAMKFMRLSFCANIRSLKPSLAPGKRLEPVLTGLGWAEPHQYEDFGTEFLIYGPRTEPELELILAIIVESFSFARHAEIPSTLKEVE